jgi:hypothetical protein
LAFLIFRDILFLGIAERPNLVALDMFAGEVFKNPILIFGTSLTEIGQELNNRVLGNARHSAGSADRIPFNEGRNNLGLFVPT